MVKKSIETTHVSNKHKPTIPVSSGEPGYGLGIAGFVTSFFVSIVGLVLSAIALKQSKAVDRKNNLAKAGFIIGLVGTILQVIWLIGFGILIAFVVVTCSKDPSNMECSRHGSSSYSDPTFFDGPTDRMRQSY